MANDLNMCCFIGRLGRDPETRYLPNGDAVTSFSIACGWKTKDKEGAEWVKVTTFGKLAEICAEYLKKGSQVFIQGRMQTRKYQDKDGQDKYTTEIVADRMQMLGSRSGASERGDEKPARQASSGGASGGGFEDFPDDIPFASCSMADEVILRKRTGRKHENLF